ncbi:MAG: hypothetical protein QNJ98_19530 [Planctomycetota bacterium]|nr:hypothetical protein [Planctomycetota bacterium]
MARSVDEAEGAVAAQDAEPDVGDARLHGRDAMAFDEDVLQRTGEALATLRSDQLQQDERRYVVRRLRELDVDLEPDEEVAATRIVLAYFREMSATWRKLRATPRDPVTAEGLYDDVTRRHHAAMAEAVPDARTARVIASALMPLR